jgi:hypothetical protein
VSEVRSIALDLLHPGPRTVWQGWLFLSLGLTAFVWTMWQDRQLDHALSDQRMAAERLRPAAALRKPAQPAKSPGYLEIQSAASQLDLPWSDLLVRIEKSRSKKIALLSLDADGRKPVVTMVAEARNLQDMLSYIESLKGDANFKSVHLASHLLREDDPQMPVRFTLLLGWRE